MLPQCVRAAIVALGKDVSKAELDGIEERMLSSMRELSRKDPTAWQGLTREQRLLQAGELSRSKYTADVLQAQARTVRDMATRTKQLRITDSFKPGKVGQLAALRQRLTMQNRYGGDIALDQQVKAVYNDFTRELDGGKLKGRFFTLVQDPTQQRTLTKAIFGESTGKPDIDMLGQQVRDVLERARTTANDAGVVINHLDNWNLPQPWAWEKVGADRTQFVKDMLAEIDPNSYVNRDGSPMTGEQIRKTIEASAETLGTNGANKRGEAMGSGYGGGVGSSRNAPRQLHFKNADGYIRMMDKYGSSNNVLSMLDHHFHGLARDIATTRSYGAAADRFVPQLIERAFAADAKSGPTSTDLIYKVLADDAKPGQSVPEMALRAAAPDAEAQLTIAQRKRLDTLKQKTASAQESKLKHLDNLKRQTIREYEALRNPGHPGALPLWAQVSNTVRGVVGSTLLGGSTLAAIPDAGMAIAYGHELGLSKRALMGNMKEGVKPTKANLEYIRRLGVTANTMLEGTHRFGAGELSNQATRFLNHGVHVLSLLRMWDRAQTHGFSASLMDLLGKKVGESDHASLDAKDQAYLASRGVTADHYATWKQAELDAGPSGQHTMLTPDAIYSIPNEKLRPIAEARIAAVSDKFKDIADRMRERNATEIQWIDGRVNKLTELRDKARSTVDQLRAKGAVNEGLARGDAEVLAEALNAKVAVAEITLKLDRTLASEKSADRIRGIMADVARVERDSSAHFDSGNTADVHESGKPENAAKAGLNAGMSIGEKLGATRARALQRLRHAEANVAKVRRESKARADTAAQKYADSIDKRTTELDDFMKASRARMDTRSEWIAEYEKAGGNLVAEDVRRLKSEAAQHLLALTISESQIGARGGAGNTIGDNVSLHITPDNAGTIMGQMARWLLFLKQTPLGIFRTHMLDVPGGMNDWKSAWAYRARFMAYSASLGALGLTLKSLAMGNDPEDLATPKGLAKVAIASGGFGMYGDFIFGDNTEHSSNGFVKTLGPGATFLSDAYDAFHATADEAQGEGSTKPGQYGAKMLKLARNYAMPFSRLWYAKAAFNHMVYQQQMEKLSPGYNARVRQRMARAKQNTWWQSGNMTPDRAPNMGAAVGQP